MSGGVRVWGSSQEGFMGALLREECWPQPSEIWPELAQRTHKGLGLEVASNPCSWKPLWPYPTLAQGKFVPPPLRDQEGNTWLS